MDLDSIEWETLGQAIRERRLARNLTLVALAQEVDLSQPFLSQVENGRARPSMISLYRIANALGTTPQAFFGGPVGNASSPALLRAQDARVVDTTDVSSQSACHLLLAGEAPFHLLEFDGLPSEFLDYWEHDGFEAVYVIAGQIEIDIDGEVTALAVGDVMSYSSRLPHRLRSISRSRAKVLLIETKVETVQDRGPVSHLPKARSRRRATAKRQPKI